MHHRSASAFMLAALGALATSSAMGQAAPASSGPLVRFDTCQKPVWPRAALERGVGGTVNLKFLIDENGKVQDALVRKSSGSTELDEAARGAIARCVFRPALRNGEPISAWASLQYIWTLDDKPSGTALAEAKRLREAGLKGDADAIYQLSVMLEGGHGVTADPAASPKLLRLAADKGHPQAALALARNHEYGQRGYPKDVPLARTWYLKAAEGGIAEAQYKTGRFLLDGTAGLQGEAQGEDWLRKAADQGHDMAAYDLALRLEHKSGANPDPTERLRLLRIAAEKDNARAQYSLAVALLRTSLAQAGPGDAQEAVRWLEAASADRHGDAELLLAELKLEGKQVPQDEVGGMQLLRRAAEGGNVTAMATLGKLLERGLHTPADANAAQQWARRAARYGTAVVRPFGSGYFARVTAA
ncbi:MAG: TonB family protein [Gammaproteobacteria bacterium]